jgi:hypothetical protein
VREELYGPRSHELLRPLIIAGIASMDAHDVDGARKHWRRAVAILDEMANPPDFGVDLLRDLAAIESGAAKKHLLADADALERRLATRAKLAAKP